MIRATIKISIALIALVAVSACASRIPHEEPPSGKAESCPPPYTLACDRFAGENRNCTCERSDRLKDILDSY